MKYCWECHLLSTSYHIKENIVHDPSSHLPPPDLSCPFHPPLVFPPPTEMAVITEEAKQWCEIAHCQAGWNPTHLLNSHPTPASSPTMPPTTATTNEVTLSPPHIKVNGAHEGHPFFTTPLLHISHLMIHHFLLLHFLKWLWPQRMPSNHHSSKSTSNHRIFSNNNTSCNPDNNTNCIFITEAKKHLEGGPLDDEHREAITCKKSTTC